MSSSVNPSSAAISVMGFIWTELAISISDKTIESLLSLFLFARFKIDFLKWFGKCYLQDQNRFGGVRVPCYGILGRSLGP